MMQAEERPNGPALAAILAASLGVFVIGLLVVLNEISGSISAALVWMRPVGPLSGKTGVGVIVWGVAWIVLASTYKGKSVNAGKILMWSWILIVLGLALTFPPVFELIVGLFKHE
jgi:hypothetical protein